MIPRPRPTSEPIAADCICGHLRKDHQDGTGPCHGIHNEHGVIPCCDGFLDAALIETGSNA
jgi:hypothetical protein